MICPHCKEDNDKVIDTRTSGDSVRRRRECLSCSNRFTTHEYVERVALTVVKRDDSKRESFSRKKLVDGIRKACVKRPISPQKIEDIAKAVENELVAIGGQEVSYQIIGDLVMRHLQQVDLVAYVRFASVYKEFKEVGEFVSLVNN